MKPISIIVLLAIMAYSNIFSNQLVIDDHIFVGKYRPTLVQAFAGQVPKGHEGVYRPIRGLFYTLYGSNPMVYHLNSLVVHILASVLVFLIISHLSSLRYLSLFSGVLFAVHPVHTETITYIASGMDTIGIVFFLLSFYLYFKDKFWLSILFAILAFFTSEMTLTLPLLILWYEWTLGGLGKLGRFGRLGAYWIAAGVYAFVRFFVLDIGIRGPYLANSFYLTMLTMTKVLVQYLGVLVWPVNLANNHIISPGIEAFVYRGYQTTAIASQSILDPGILGAIGVIGVIGIIGWRLRKKHPLVSFGIGWFFVGLLPVMEFVPQGSIMNEKSLYIASMGFVLILGYGLGKLGKFGVMGMIVIALFYGVRTYVRNADWHDDVVLWSREDSAYARFALGNAYAAQKQFGKAIDQYQKSVELNPGFAVGFASLSRTYNQIGNSELSNLNYQKAESIEPGFWTRP